MFFKDQVSRGKGVVYPTCASRCSVLNCADFLHLSSFAHRSWFSCPLRTSLRLSADPSDIESFRRKAQQISNEVKAVGFGSAPVRSVGGSTT